MLRRKSPMTLRGRLSIMAIVGLVLSSLAADQWVCGKIEGGYALLFIFTVIAFCAKYGIEQVERSLGRKIL